MSQLLRLFHVPAAAASQRARSCGRSCRLASWTPRSAPTTRACAEWLTSLTGEGTWGLCCFGVAFSLSLLLAWARGRSVTPCQCDPPGPWSAPVSQLLSSSALVCDDSLSPLAQLMRALLACPRARRYEVGHAAKAGRLLHYLPAWPGDSGKQGSMQEGLSRGLRAGLPAGKHRG